MSERDLLVLVRVHKDSSAREELITRYLPLVRSLARRFASRGQPVEDLIQVGCIGLIKAIDRFDLDRGVELSTYATPTILGEIKRYFRDKGWAVKVPRALQDLNVRLNRVMESLTVELQQVSDHQRVGRGDAGHRKKKWSKPWRVGGLTVRCPSSREGVPTKRNRWACSTTWAAKKKRTRCSSNAGYSLRPWSGSSLVSGLILHLRFFEGMTQTQVAARIGISQMHVSRLIRKSIENLRQYMAEGCPDRRRGGERRGLIGEDGRTAKDVSGLFCRARPLARP